MYKRQVSACVSDEEVEELDSSSLASVEDEKSLSELESGSEVLEEAPPSSTDVDADPSEDVPEALGPNATYPNTPLLESPQYSYPNPGQATSHSDNEVVSPGA